MTRLKICSAAVLLLALLALVGNTRAATVTWVGNTSTNWNTAANWSSANVPTNNDSLVFTNAGTAGAGLNNDIPGGRIFNGIIFTNNASAFIFYGNAFGLNGTIANFSASVQTINAAIILTNAGTVNAATTNIVIGGAISDNGSNCNLTLSGVKGVTLTGSNSFGGTLAINSGVTVTISSTNNLGSGTNISFGGSANSSLSATASVVIPASTTITVGTGSTASIGSPTAGTVVEVAARITGAGAVQKKSSSYSLGTVRFSNDTNNFTGTFTAGYGNTEFTSVADSGTPCSLGLGTTNSGAIILGNSSSVGTLRYVGTNNSATHRPLFSTATTGGYTLDVTNTGTIAYLNTTSNLMNGAGSKTLTLQGSNTGTNTLAQVINDNGGTTTLNKSGTGTWVLAGTNIFSGGVNLNGGVLQVNAAENPGVSGALGASGTISFGGGTLQFSPANTFDYSSRFSATAGQACSVDTAGQTVTFATALVSSNGTLTVNSSAPGGILILAKTNIFTGNVTVLGGTLSVSNDPALGVITNSVVLNGGTLLAVTNFNFNFYRTMALGPDSGNGPGTVNVLAGVTLTHDGYLADNGGSGSLIKTGAGTLAIAADIASSYTGNTVISNGTLSIAGSVHISTNKLTIVSGATLDVSSATGGYTLGTGQTLVAGNGTSFVKGKLKLGSSALALFWTNGVPSLTISGNSLVMSNNAVAVTVAGGTPLPVGVYKIISKGTGGSVTGAVSNSLVNVNGAGALAGASLQITSGELYLNVHGSTATTTTIATSTNTIPYGSPVTLIARVSPTNATGVVTFSDSTTTYGTATLSGGQASLTIASGVLNAGIYLMSASYNGNATYGPSSSVALTQTVSQVALTVAANNLSRWVGNANPTLTATFVGFVAGDTSTVLSGTPSLTTTATSASPIGNYPITITQGTLTDTSGNYVLAFTNGMLSVITRVMPYPQGTAFPLMMYEVGDAPSAANVASYGWNIIQNYGLNTNSDINTFLQLGYPDSLGGDAPIPCGGDVSTNFVEWPQAQVQAWIQGSMTNNNIAWWDMPEEMRSWKPTEVQLLKDYRAWIQLYDTNGQRPTYEYTPNNRYAADQIGIVTNVDIIGASCYCEAAGQPHAWVRYKVAESGVHAVTLGGRTIGSNYLSGQKTVVSVLYLADPGNGSLPTPQQSYHDVWSSIASGAQGITIWAYWHGVNDTGGVLLPNLAQFNLAASQISGSEIGSVILYGAQNTNVNFIVTAGPTNTDSFNPGDGTNWVYPSINVLCKTWSNSVYVIAVNSTSNSVTATITNLPVTSATAALPFEIRSVGVTNGSISDAFPAWGVHVYKMAATTMLVPPVLNPSVSFGAGGFTLSFSGANAQSYRVLASTNLLVPLANWLVLTNGTFGASSVNFTDSAATNLQKFYRIVSP